MRIWAGERGGIGKVIDYPEIDKYAGLSSPIHNWDPRAKLVSILCLIFAVVLIPDLKIAFVGLAIALILVFISKIPFSFILKQLRWVMLLIFPLFVLISLTYHQGDEIVRFHFLTVTSDGLRWASLISVRALAAVILIFPMIATLRFNTTVKALERLRIPNKLVQMIMFTYRYIFVFVAELQRIWRSLESRGFKAKMNIYTIQTMGKVMGTHFVRSYDRAEHVYNAMSSRGYGDSLRTLDEFEMKTKDVIKASLVVGVAVVLHCFTGVF